MYKILVETTVLQTSILYIHKEKEKKEEKREIRRKKNKKEK